MTTKNPARALRELIERPGMVCSLGAHDVLSALMIEQAGYETVFMGGFGTSASIAGYPDINFLNMMEMVDASRRMAQRLSIPVIADADTGHGDLHNVMRCVEGFEMSRRCRHYSGRPGLSKRCGHFGGNQVIEADEMVTKFKAADAARKQS